MNSAAHTKRIGKLLIVDDSAAMRAAIRSLMEDFVVEICEASNGKSAIELYLSQKPDWVTLDIAMQPVNGIATARTIRATDPRSRIIIVTAHDNQVFRDAARQAGVTGYVLKDDLSKIREVIQTNES